MFLKTPAVFWSVQILQGYGEMANKWPDVIDRKMRGVCARGLQSAGLKWAPFFIPRMIQTKFRLNFPPLFSCLDLIAFLRSPSMPSFSALFGWGDATETKESATAPALAGEAPTTRRRSKSKVHCAAVLQSSAKAGPERTSPRLLFP